MSVRILQGDCRAVMASLPADSVDCVVTSPPYWGLRDYGVVGQLGLETTLGEHLDVMVEVFEAVRRVLKPSGTLWLNYGDCYATSPNGRSPAETKAAGGTFNIGSGQDRSVTEVAQSLALAMGRNDGEPEIVGKARTGDIRHCFCDTGKAEEVLGFRARQDFQQGLAVLAEWVARQTADDRVNQARAELEARGLVA